ncbi:MAG: hypothetical protein IT332_10490 [Ardenticatenales bacterium]|nr:hypothetical protein [Ardenticatenales bacterium]
MRRTTLLTALLLVAAAIASIHRAYAATDLYFPVAYGRPPRAPSTPVPGTATRTPHPTAYPTLHVADVRYFTNPNDIDALAIDERRDAVWTIGNGGSVRWSAAGSEAPEPAVFNEHERRFADDLAVSDDGSLWVPDWNGVHRRTPAGAWTWLPSPERLRYDGAFGGDDFERVAADHDGGVWFASRDGAMRRKAGRAWEPARLGDPERIAEVGDPVAASNGDVWFGFMLRTDTGRMTAGVVVRRADGRWESFTDGSSAPQFALLGDIAVGPDGTVWAVGQFGIEPEVERLRPNGAAFEQAVLGDLGATWRAADANGDIGNVESIAVDAAGRPWLASMRALVVPQDPDARTWRVEVMDDEIRDFALRPDGSAWLSTPRGLVHRSAAGRYTTFMVPGLPSERVRALALGSGGVWVATDGGIATISASGRIETYAHEVGATGSPVNDVAAAADGSVWLSTARDIGHRDLQGRWSWFTAREGLIDAPAGPLAIDRDGGVWCIAGHPRAEGQPADAQYGVNQRQPDGRWRTFGTADGLPNLRGRSILARRDGSVWVGFDAATADSEPARDRFNLVRNAPSAAWFGVQTPAAVQSQAIVAMAEDSGGALWLLTQKGLARLAADGTWRTYEDEPAWRLRPSTENSTTETALVVDDGGNVYTGTGGALARIRPDGTRAGAWSWLNGNDVTDAVIGPDGRVWLALAFGGVRSFRAVGLPPPIALVAPAEQPVQHPAHE